MIPLLPTLALSFLSFFCTAFVILRIVIPILPPHPLSRRVAPKEFGLPNFKSLSQADKAHLWLALCDLAALSLFIWETLQEYVTEKSGIEDESNVGSTVRLWLTLTLRQTCLLVISSVILLSLRMGRPVSFGSKHWVIWAPTFLIAITSTTIAGVLAGAGVKTLFIGVVSFSSGVALLTTGALTWLVITLLAIQRNLAAAAEPKEPWPPLEDKQPRPSFATEDIDALRDGSSWLTSYAGSRRGSLSTFSFSTTHTGLTHGSARLPNPMSSQTSLPAKSSFWFGNGNNHGRTPSPVPPVPPLPSPYRPSSPASSESLHDDPDPFRRTPVPRMGSQNSWLSEDSVSQATLSAWSFPTTIAGTPMPNSSTNLCDDMQTKVDSRTVTPAMSSAQVLGGYGYTPTPISLGTSEKGLTLLPGAPTKDINVSPHRLIGWFVLIWIPTGLSIPYLVVVSEQQVPAILSVLFILSVTLSSTFLALNLFFCPLLVPSGLFETRTDASFTHATPSTLELPTPYDFAERYKRSGSLTVVEGRRSGDVWVEKGDAIDGKNKFGRAMTLLTPVPKLSVLPPSPSKGSDGELTPPLPLQVESPSPSAFATPQSENSIELGRAVAYREENDHAYLIAVENSMAVATRIMTAERHYSAMAKTLIIPPSPIRSSYDVEGIINAYTSATATTPPARQNTHMRSRSTSTISKSSFSGPRSPISPPPSSPLPPTPPKKEQESSSSGYSFNAVNDINEIDSLSAKLLPILVPGLKIGPDMRIKDSPTKVFLFNASETFSSPDQTSTPVKPAKKARNKRHHLSLPSLGLGRDGLHSLANWKDDISKALGVRISPDVKDDGRRRTVVGTEAKSATISHAGPLNPVYEDDEISRLETVLNASLSVDQHANWMEHGINPTATGRSSMATLIAALEPLPSTDLEESSIRPMAESTPKEARHHDMRTHVMTQDQSSSSSSRRSSIIYIKSDEITPESPRRYSGRAPVVRPLQTRRTSSADKENQNSIPVDSKGLRRLSLLQQQNLNSIPENDMPSKGIKPLNLTKKYKPADENSNSSQRKILRSATNKARAILRKNEVLPNVVIRPPSNSDHIEFSYEFQRD